MVKSIAAFLLYVLGAELLLVVRILVALWAPKSFDALDGWLRANDRHITIVVSVLVGGYFLWRGASGLIGLNG